MGPRGWKYCFGTEIEKKMSLQDNKTITMQKLKICLTEAFFRLILKVQTQILILNLDPNFRIFKSEGTNSNRYLES